MAALQIEHNRDGQDLTPYRLWIVPNAEVELSVSYNQAKGWQVSPHSEDTSILVGPYDPLVIHVPEPGIGALLAGALLLAVLARRAARRSA